MKPIVLALLLLFGCDASTSEAPSDAATVDAGTDATPAPADACIAAQGNCGCIVVLDYNSATGVSTSTVVCP